MTVAVALTVALLATAPAVEYPSDVERWRRDTLFWFGDHADEALKIIECESTGVPTKKGPYARRPAVGRPIGLFQIQSDNLYGWPHRSLASIRDTWPETATSLTAATEWLKVPVNNFYAAWLIWRDRGWWADWECAQKVLRR